MMKTIRGQRGEVLLRGAISVLLASMLLSAGLEIYHVYHTLGLVREKTNEAVLAVAAVNVAEFYGGAREADGYARHPEEGGFAFSIATDDVVDRLAYSLNATELSEDDLITVGKSFSVETLNTQYVNYSGGNLNFRTTLTVRVPLDIGGVLLPALSKQMEVRTSYAPKF